MSQVSYPVYRIGKNKPTISDGVACYLYENLVEDSDGSVVSSNKVRILDDTTLAGATLATRRLQLQSLGVPLLKLNRALFFLGDLIKIADKNTWFIDSLGKIFTLQKSTRAKLTFHKVVKLVDIPTGGVIIECDDYSVRFKALFKPDIPLENLYAGILHHNKALILYGFYAEKHKDTWRLI